MTILRRLGLAGALASTLAFGVGCSETNRILGRNQQTWTMQPAAAVQAAEGKVQVATEKDGNHDLQLKVEHMSPADMVFAGKSTYVVWLKPENGHAQNVGVLPIDKDLKGELDTKTSFGTFEVKVTAEQSASATTPSGAEVMQASVVVAS
ncbi:MAG TPA: hypothetical protein VH853_14810 [Polyangia bacterium]|jgi:hypothetical protein|nr:hypothetical protein [Polyangia bacterium]